MNDSIAVEVEKIAQWQKLKTLVLDSVSSPITVGALVLRALRDQRWARGLADHTY